MRRIVGSFNFGVKNLPDMRIHMAPGGDTVIMKFPAGGDFGDPKKRSAAAREVYMEARFSHKQ